MCFPGASNEAAPISTLRMELLLGCGRGVDECPFLLASFCHTRGVYASGNTIGAAFEVSNLFQVRIARPTDTAAIIEWLLGSSSGWQQMISGAESWRSCWRRPKAVKVGSGSKRKAGPAFDNSLAAVSKRLSVNPDLVSATELHSTYIHIYIYTHTHTHIYILQ